MLDLKKTATDLKSKESPVKKSVAKKSFMKDDPIILSEDEDDKAKMIKMKTAA